MWQEAQKILERGWLEICDRGSVADSGLEPGMDWMTGIEALWPMHKAAGQGVAEWLQTGQWPTMPPAAMRLAEFQVYFALDLCRRLGEQPWVSAPKDWEPHNCIEWLLSLWHSAVLPSIDHTVGDLLENAGEATPEEM